MKNSNRRKAAAMILALVLTMGCSAKKSEESSQHTTPQKTPETTPTPEPTPTPSSEAGKKTVHEFDPNTNQTISFGEFQIEIPQGWKEGNDGWYAMRNGTAEASVSVTLDASGTEEYSDEYLLKDPSIFGRFFTEGTYTAVNDTPLRLNDLVVRRALIKTNQGEAAGILNIEACLCSDPTQIAYVLAFIPTESAYDFSPDIRDILDSLRRSEETASRMHPENESVPEIQKQLDDAKLTAATNKLEYSAKTTDLLSLVKCSDPEVTVTTDSVIDLKKLGKQTVTYLLTLKGERREVKQTFEIEDTKVPEIKLKNSTVTVEYGASYDPYTNIESVSDPADGALKAVSGQKDAKIDTYYIDGKLDTSRAGSYELTVHAMDANTNVSTKTFTVTVNAQPQTEVRADYIGNANTMKFHLPDCRSVSKMSDRNKVKLTDKTRDEVIHMGYTPCSICNP